MYQLLKETWADLTKAGAPFEVEEIELWGNLIRAYKNAPTSLREIWLASAAFGDDDYLVYEDERWSYREAHEQVASIANWLQAQGIGPGDRVALAMRNYPEWLLSYWAVVSMGATVVGMNAWWVGPEMVYALKDSTPKVLICDEERLLRVLEHATEFPNLRLVGVRLPEKFPSQENMVAWKELLTSGGSFSPVIVDADSDACIFYTSGTTGQPKGAQLTHRGCVANLLNMAFWKTAATEVAIKRGVVPAPDPEMEPPKNVTLLTTPLFHVTANNCGAHAVTFTGGKLVHMYRWDAREAIRLIEKERITNVSGVPVMARELLAHSDFKKKDMSSLLTVGGGGAQLQPDLVMKINEQVETAHPSTGYGMTETCGIITAIAGEFFVNKPESCGPIMPTLEAKCVDPAGNVVPQGEVGELWVKGAPVIRGYLNRAEATRETITDGWLHTGDVARIDEDGFVFIVDRVKDMVLRGGENIFCSEVESAIFKHKAVAECSVFGVPDDRLGEEVGAAVVLTANANVTADDIRAHLQALIAKFKIPRYCWFLEEGLPRNANGKFLKCELQKQLDPKNAS